MKSIREIKDFNGKSFLVRVDFDVPVSKDGKIEEPFRIIKQKENLDYIISRGGIVSIISHISSIGSFSLIIEELQSLLGYEIKLSSSIDSFKNKSPELIILLDNIRKFDGELENSEELANRLGAGFDYYVNNAFAVCHRNHSSVSAITKVLPSYAGLLVLEEVNFLSKALTADSDGKVVIIGGAKGETKLPVVKNFIDKADKIIVGGVVANDILKARGMDISDSSIDKNLDNLINGLDINSPKLVLPLDFTKKEDRILDLGPRSIDLFKSSLSGAKMVIWNGPLGLFEDPEFSYGTKEMALFLSELDCFRIIGGGDTISAIQLFFSLDKFDFISTGGGAMLYFLSSQAMPGLEALK